MTVPAAATMPEQALLLGDRKSLVGVLSQPAPAAARPAAPTIVILNSGIIHRVGANRTSVGMARALAAAGFTVLRFDLAGLGDSEPRLDAVPPLEASLADIREVLDSLETTRQARRFVLVGLCSGADHSVLYAGTDARVAGAILIDPSIPHTLRYHVRHYGRKLVRLRTWINFLRGQHLAEYLRRRRGLAGSGEPQDVPLPNLQAVETRAFLERAYRSAVEKGNRMLAIFTAGRQQQHNYRTQLLDAFPRIRFGKQLRLAYFDGCDHTFTTEANRARLNEAVVEWARATFGEEDGGERNAGA